MSHQISSGKLYKLASACTIRQTATYSSRILSSRRWKGHSCSIISRNSLRYTSTNSAAGVETQRQQRPVNLRSQLPLVDVISSTTQSTASTSSYSSSNFELDQISKSKKPRSFLRPCIYALLFFATGSLVGNFMCTIVIPKESPAPGSSEDDLMIKYLHGQAEKLPLVQSLRSDPLWDSVDSYKLTGDFNIEISTNETNKVDEKKMEKEMLKRRLTAGPLAGSRALGGYQELFCNVETGDIIKIFWFGAAISGWPGVTHGGLSATVIDETLGRCAAKYLEGHKGVTANLQINYLKPVLTKGFYVIRGKALENGEGLDSKKLPDQQLKRKQWITGTLETIDGVTCVTAKALFVVPKKYKLK